ncbi:hypothetical protein HN011_005994 [Eciton burchellii]|nr:hypothetical protein HN011_005994 [Eciton burchellii]
MAPRREAKSNLYPGKSSKKSNKSWIGNYLEWQQITSLLIDPKKLSLTAKLFIILEIVLNVLIIEKVPYTEIDWRAYMQEVEGFLNGTLDYSKLRGDTGPLVYPAGFVYIFSGLPICDHIDASFSNLCEEQESTALRSNPDVLYFL